MYVGAISILFLFVIMITDTGKTPVQRGNNKDSKIYAIILLCCFIIPWAPFFWGGGEAKPIFEVFVPSYNTEFASITDIQSLGYVIYLAYPIIIVL